MAEVERRRIIELGRLRADGRDDRIAAMAGIAAPQTRRPSSTARPSGV